MPPGSGADLFILVEEAEQRPMDRIPRFLRFFSRGPIGVDVLIYIPAEIETMRRERNLLLVQIEREKIKLA
jgi:hypothetical protein